jgi:hypothetical protein
MSIMENRLFRKGLAVGILGLLLIIGNISATRLTLNDNSEKSTMLLQESPVTYLYYDPETGMVTLIAYQYGDECPITGTYYKIDGGEQQTYTEPFFIGEGTHSVTYWSEDMCGNIETPKTATFIFDSTPPTVEITSPEEGKLYLFGSPVIDRILDNKTLCIGKVPVAANANDGAGSGVSMVMFSFSNGDSSYDDDGTNGFTYLFEGMHFGPLTITAVAMDNIGLTSTPDSMTLDVYNLGLI